MNWKMCLIWSNTMALVWNDWGKTTIYYAIASVKLQFEGGTTDTQRIMATRLHVWGKEWLFWLYTPFNKNKAAWYFVHPAQAVMWRTVAIIIRVVLVSPYLCIRGISLSFVHYKQSRRVYINQRHQYIRLTFKNRVSYI
jgi:hypothetical protein